MPQDVDARNKSGHDGGGTVRRAARRGTRAGPGVGAEIAHGCDSRARAADARMRGRFRRGGALTALLITVFMDMVGFGIIIPLTPFWAERFGAGPATVTLLFATYSAFGFVFSFLWGWASDKWGRKPILLLSLMGSVLSFLWLGFAEALWMLFAARAMGGIFGANVAVGQAYIAGRDDRRRTGRRGSACSAPPSGSASCSAPRSAASSPARTRPTPISARRSSPRRRCRSVGVVFGLLFLPEPERRERPGGDTASRPSSPGSGRCSPCRPSASPSSASR